MRAASKKAANDFGADSCPALGATVTVEGEGADVVAVVDRARVRNRCGARDVVGNERIKPVLDAIPGFARAYVLGHPATSPRPSFGPLAHTPARLAVGLSLAPWVLAGLSGLRSTYCNDVVARMSRTGARAHARGANRVHQELTVYVRVQVVPSPKPFEEPRKTKVSSGGSAAPMACSGRHRALLPGAPRSATRGMR